MFFCIMPDQKDQTELIELNITEEMKDSLQKVLAFKSVPGIQFLIRQYIQHGLKEDLEKIKQYQNAVKARQTIINEIEYLLGVGPCIYCDSDLEIVETSIFSAWNGEFIAICPNDTCPHTTKSWEVLKSQGASGGYVFYRDSHGNSGSLPIGPTQQTKIKSKFPKGKCQK